ncbi:MAG: phosphate ABC transporter permease PstA [Promethearchaeota archaeon]
MATNNAGEETSGRRRLLKSRREFLDIFAFGLLAVIAVIITIPFFAIVFEVINQGWILLFSPIDPNGRFSPGWFILQIMEGFAGGGIRNAIVGSLELVVLASVVAIPLCVGAAVYTTEYAQRAGGRTKMWMRRFNKWVIRIVEFTADVLAGVPSIIFGAFGLIFFVQIFGRSLIAGALTLGLMMIPTILRTTQESLRAVPVNLREASLAVGATTWSTSWRVVIRAAFAGIITGVLLAVGRVIGETAPLLFTTGFNFDNPWGLLDAVASLPFTIYLYALQGHTTEIRLRAYSAAIVLVIIVFVVDVVALWGSKKVGLVVRAGGV